MGLTWLTIFQGRLSLRGAGGRGQAVGIGVRGRRSSCSHFASARLTGWSRDLAYYRIIYPQSPSIR